MTTLCSLCCQCHFDVRNVEEYHMTQDPTGVNLSYPISKSRQRLWLCGTQIFRLVRGCRWVLCGNQSRDAHVQVCPAGMVRSRQR